MIRDGDLVIENIEFRGARVPHGNGTGIRFERGRRRVRNSAFVDNQTGILTGNDREAALEIDASLFADAPRQEHSLPHRHLRCRHVRLRAPVRAWTPGAFQRAAHGQQVFSRASASEGGGMCEKPEG